ncbi:CgeB family protein [Pinibacter aurantiacus]|uniref:Glycosyltransferase n=1 Tax=Pinibacter aurantiacus TaxID=2851599 RepID=A0A9E2S751_9BACT|nr:glycosyltransferase [Pinibacter aurantiacus]MBV4357848.1 glycosyltransferase [Pinibacter aurantiacus]
MNLLLVGSDKIFAIENIYVKYLKEKHDVTLFPAQSIFYDYYYRKGIVHKLLFKAGLSSIYRNIDKLLIEKIEAVKPQAVWVFKGMEISPKTLQWIKSRGIRLVNYNPDNPFIFSGRGSGNSNITNSIGLYDLHFTYNHEIKERLQKDYNALVEDLPFGFEINDSVFSEAQNQEEINKACFLGNPDKERAALVNGIAESGLPLDVFGNDWKSFVKSENITVHEPVYKDDLWKTLRRYRVQLNMMRVHNENSHNMRTFEIPAIGGIQLAPDTVEHRFFFNEGKDIFLYKSIDDCIQKVKALIALPASEAEQIRVNARRTSIENKYSYRDRALHAAEKIKRIL